MSDFQPRIRNPASLLPLSRPEILSGSVFGSASPAVLRCWRSSSWAPTCSGFGPTFGPGGSPAAAPSDCSRSRVRKAVCRSAAGTPGCAAGSSSGHVLRRWPRAGAGRAQPGAAARAGNPHWALVDVAQLRQEGDPKKRRRGSWAAGSSSARVPGTTEPSDPAGRRSGCCPGRQVGVDRRPALAASSPSRRTFVMNPNPQPPVSLWPDRRALGPVTDLYQLTMMAGYLATGMGEEAGHVRALRPEDAAPSRLPGLRRARAGDR